MRDSKKLVGHLYAMFTILVWRQLLCADEEPARADGDHRCPDYPAADDSGRIGDVCW